MQTSTLNTMKFLEENTEKQGNLFLLWKKFLCSRTKLQTYKKDFSESKMYAVTIMTLAHINAYFRIMLFLVFRKHVHTSCLREKSV